MPGAPAELRKVSLFDQINFDTLAIVGNRKHDVHARRFEGHSASALSIDRCESAN